MLRSFYSQGKFPPLPRVSEDVSVVVIRTQLETGLVTNDYMSPAVQFRVYRAWNVFSIRSNVPF